MTRDEIITDLFKSREFNACIKKMEPAELQDDLRAEVMLTLCEYPVSKIEELHNSNGLRFFAVRIILNMIQSKSSPFYMKFRRLTWQSIEDVDVQFPVDTDVDIAKNSAMMAIDDLYWYDREIIKLYMQHGTYRAVEKETGIPWESVYKTVQKGCRQIRQMISA